jgi:hypothetical protein
MIPFRSSSCFEILSPVALVPERDARGHDTRCVELLRGISWNQKRKGNRQTTPYQENSFFFVGVICPIRAVKGEPQHPGRLWQAAKAKSIVPAVKLSGGRRTGGFVNVPEGRELQFVRRRFDRWACALAPGCDCAPTVSAGF